MFPEKHVFKYLKNKKIIHIQERHYINELNMYME